VLRPGGRLAYLWVHPAYVGAFVARDAEVAHCELRIVRGYDEERLQRDPTGRYPDRERRAA
jgi:hypothetical protein